MPKKNEHLIISFIGGNMKDIKGYENIYKITKDGKVFSVRANRFLKTWIINSGYEAIDLRLDGVLDKKLVHRIVATAFCSGKEPGLDVNHIDGDRLHNHYSNLEWVTRKENIHHNMKRGVFDVKTAQAVAHEKNKKRIAALDKVSGEIIKEFGSIDEARTWAGKNPNLNRAFTSGGIAAGYKWKLLDDDIV